MAEDRHFNDLRAGFVRNGFLDMLLATILFFLMAVCVKALPRIPTSEVVFFRGSVALVISVVAIRLRKVSLFGTHRVPLIIRGICGTLALIGYFHSLQNLPLATATTVQQLAPLFTTILAVAFLREEVGPVEWICVIVAFVGVVIINGFTWTSETISVLIGVGAAWCSAMAYTSIAVIKHLEDPLTVIFYFPLVTVPVILPFAIRDWVTPTATEWFLLILIGFIVQLAQYYMTLAYQRGHTAKVSTVTYLGIVFSVIAGYVVFKEVLDTRAICGIVVIVTAVAINAMRSGGKNPRRVGQSHKP